MGKVRQESKCKTKAGWERCPSRRAPQHVSVPEWGEESIYVRGQATLSRKGEACRRYNPEQGFRATTGWSKSPWIVGAPLGRVRAQRVKRAPTPGVDRTQSDRVLAGGGGFPHGEVPGMRCHSPGRVRRVILQRVWAQVEWGHLHSGHM